MNSVAQTRISPARPLPRIAQRTSAKIWYRPFLPGGLYKIVGTHS